MFRPGIVGSRVAARSSAATAAPKSRDFTAAAQAAGSPATLEIVPRRTHFDVLEDLARPELPLFQRVLGAVQRAPRPADSHHR